MTKFVYTFSSVGDLRNQLLHSLKSLLHYTDPDDVIVFATPPLNSQDLDLIEQTGVDIRQKDHVADEFVAFDRPQHYADKWHLTSVSADSIVFLDCDTLVFDDPHQLVSGPRFRAREGNASIDSGKWRAMFESLNEPLIDWMPNAGVLVFDNGLHQEIAEDWWRFLQKDLPHLHENYHKEQYALALAVGGYEANRLSPREHVFEWDEAPLSDGIVYHLHTDNRVGLYKEFKIKANKFKSNLCAFL